MHDVSNENQRGKIFNYISHNRSLANEKEFSMAKLELNTTNLQEEQS